MGALDWLKDNPSVEDAKVFIENHPDALMGIEDRWGDIDVPLHIAIYHRASDEVILLLLEACPRVAKENFDGYNALHLAIGDTTCSEKVIKALIDAHPGAASVWSPGTKNLTLHHAVNMSASEGIILLLLNAYPQAAAEKMYDGRFLFEICLERNASDDLMQKIFKIRVDGLLPLGVVLTKRSSDDIVLAVLEVYPEAAGKRFSTKFDECILPLHIAYEDNHSEPVKDALRHAYPDAENENPFETTYQLHKFLENKPFDQLDKDNVKNLIKMYPEAAGKRGRDGRLPLHIAIDRIASPGVIGMLFRKYPQAGKEKMKDGRLPIEVLATQKVTDDWTQESLTDMVSRLLFQDMPVSIEDGTPKENSGSWHACISYSTETATRAVRRILLDSEKQDDDSWYGGGCGKYIHALADARDAKGRAALGLAAEGPREVIYEFLLFCGRYKLQIGPPEHRTATSVVLRAQDLAEQADYGVIFDKADNDGNGKLDRKELKAIAISIGLDPDLFLKGSDAEESDESIFKEEFVAICKRQLGDGPREVVIKLMQSKDHWERECNARKDYELESKYVVSALPNVPSDTEIADAVRDSEGGLDIIREKYLDNIELGIYAFVMEAGDRDLLQMFYQEQPNIDDVRAILRQVFEAVQHLHQEKLMHGDIKMLNIVRFGKDNGLRLIDLDASATIVPHGEDDEKKRFAGAKFSSAILPPEMIDMIETDRIKDFNAYWEGEEDEVLIEKMLPKIYKEQGIAKAYVVKSFRTKEGKLIVDKRLPYELVHASENIDVWSLGVLAFTLLTGEALVPSTREDDCGSGAAMHLLFTWGKQPEVMSDLFKKIHDGAARDLVMQLLMSKPEERPTVAEMLEHPFFKPQSVEMVRNMDNRLEEIHESLKSQAKQLETINANILVIKELSYESQSELLRTRHVLLKGIFEATEVSTPTAFIVLNNKLPSNEEVEKKILNIEMAEDGSGVSIDTQVFSMKATAEGVVCDFKVLKQYRKLVEDGIKQANEIKRVGSKVAEGQLKPAFDMIMKKMVDEKLVGEKMYLYLIDELTGEPVRAEDWPIEITTPSDIVSKLLPLMQVGIRAISIFNGVAGLVRMFGYPLPKVPECLSKGAQESVELLKQESSVEEFAAVHKEVKGGTEVNTSVRGASLRDFMDFLNKYDPGLKNGKNGRFAGLRRIGDPDQGTALWTMLDPADIQKALETRASQRKEEERKQNMHNQEMAESQSQVTTQEVTNEETSGTEEVHSLTDEFAKQNDTRNVLAASEEIGDLIRAPKGAAAAAKEPATAAKAAASAPAAAQDSDEIAKLMKQHLKAMEEATTAAKEAAAAAKEAASTPATGSVCCTIM